MHAIATNRTAQGQKGFVLVVCLIVTLVVSLGSVALMRYANSQTQKVTMTQFQALLRSEANWIANQVFSELQSQADFETNPQTNTANWQCNAVLPNGIDNETSCVLNQAHPLPNNGLLAEANVTLTFLGQLPVRGNEAETHLLYRIDVRVTLNDQSVLIQRLVSLDRIG